MYIQKKQLTKAKVTILFIACFCAAVSIIFRIFGEEASVPMGFLPVSAVPQEYHTVIIDAGHGGADGGAIGVDGQVEKEINLAIAKNLEDFLKLSGMKTVMVRQEDVSIHDDSAKTVAEQKVSDIQNRFRLTKEHPNAIVVSIHQNHFTQSQYYGAQMFYGTQNPLSEELAQKLQTTFVENLQPENERQIKPGTSSVYLLKNVTNPIVLVECGFLSNPEEAALLSDTEYQRKVAFTVYSGIMKFLEER